MSTVRMGWETWIGLAVEAATGTANNTAAYLWESADGAADSLDLGYQRTEGHPISGYRAVLAQSIRNTHQLPGGALPPAPLWMNGSSLWLLHTLEAHGMGSAVAGSAWTFTPATVQRATAAFPALTVIKRTGIDGRAEVYAGGVIDELTFSGAHGGYVSITPTFKFLSGTHHATAGTGSLTPTTAPYFTAADTAITWNGETIYPSAWSITSRNNIPDKLATGAFARSAYCLGDYTGEASITIPRDDGMGTNFLTKYMTPAVGTLIVQGTSTAGTVAGGGVLTWKLTALLVPRPFALPAQAGELTDTIGFDLTGAAGLTVVITSDASAL